MIRRGRLASAPPNDYGRFSVQSAALAKPRDVELFTPAPARRRQHRPYELALLAFGLLLLLLILPLPELHVLAQEVITLQQGKEGYTGCQDAHILANKPDWNTGAEEGLEASGNGGEADAKHALLRFDLSGLPAAAQLDSAWLELFLVKRRTVQSAAKTLALYRLNRPWSEGLGNDPGGYDGRPAAGGEVCWQYAVFPDQPWALPGAGGVPLDHEEQPEVIRLFEPAAPVAQWYSWDVTRMAQSWLAHPDSNQGVILREPVVSAPSGILNFASAQFAPDSLRPRLHLRLTSQSPGTTALRLATSHTSDAIMVIWPFRGDADRDGAAEVAIARAGEAQWGPRQPMTRGPAAYTLTFAGLSHGRYHLRGWISDPDGVQGEAVQTLLNIELTPNTSRVGTLYTTLLSDNSLQVRLTFSDDSNSNNSALLAIKRAAELEWGQESAMKRAAGEFSTLLTGLASGETYDLRATLHDPDGISGDSIRTVQISLPATTGEVRLLSAGKKSFHLQSGFYTARYDSAATGPALWIAAAQQQVVLRDEIAGGLPFALLDPALIDSVTVDSDSGGDGITACLYGRWNAVTWQVIFQVFFDHPGLFRWQCLVAGGASLNVQNSSGECRFYDRERGYSVSSPGLIRYVQQAPYCAGVAFGYDPLAVQGTLLYFQDFSSSNDYYTLQRAAPRECVRLGSSGFGYERPAGSRPLRAEATQINDGWLVLEPGKPASEAAAAERFTAALAEIYDRIQRPPLETTDWDAIARALVPQLEDERCLATVHGEKFFRSYVGVPRLANAEAITQLDVLIGLRRYEAVHGQVSEIDERLARDLWSFYNLRHNTMVNDTPNEGVQEGDSWYAIHIHLGLARLARMGDGHARTLLLLSLPKLIAFAQQVNYDFPVFFRYTDNSAISGHEYDASGGYLYTMLDAWELTRDQAYLQEALAAAEHLQGHGFEYTYEAHMTAATCAALARLWQITGDRRYLEMSYMPFANLMALCWLWECDYGYASEYRTFFGLSPMAGAAVITPMEQHHSWSYLREYRQIAASGLPQGLLELLDGFIAYTPTVMKYALPPFLPAAALVNGPSVYDSWNVPAFYIPLEDLRDGWQKSGSLGQQLYGAGAALLFAAELTTGLDQEGEEPLRPELALLLQNYPNPFNSGTMIRYRAPWDESNPAARLKLDVFDILGRKIRSLPVKSSPGEGEIYWDGRSDHQEMVSGGLYFIVFEAAGEKQVRKILLLR